MKHKLTVAPRILRKEAAEEYVGGQQNLKSLREAGWVVPLRMHKCNTSFDIRDLDRAVDRANLDGWPVADKKN